MKIVLFGATGNVGRRIAAEATRRGHSVTGVVRDPAAVASPVAGVTLVRGDQPGFPEAYKAEALQGREALGLWRAKGTSLDWTYLSPAIEIGPGERTGKYRTTQDQVLTDAAGKSFISFEDFAVAALDELE